MRVLLENTIAVCIDMQERLFTAIHNNESIEQKAITLISGLNELGTPIIVTEQYPKGLGSTIESLQTVLDEDKVEKVTFSCCDEVSFVSELEKSNRKTVLLFGIEAHVCVLQTAVDLITKGFNVFVIVDCVSSRNAYDKDIALRRLEKEGVYLTTMESVLFELCRSSKNGSFKTISALVK